VGVALGLGAALCRGLADDVATRAARAIGTLPVALGFTLLATLVLALVALPTGALDDVDGDDLPFFALVGAMVGARTSRSTARCASARSRS
jgi:drug/metabolite transporter (DMT)-like permease